MQHQISQDPSKMTIPGKKDVYRLYDQNDKPVVDLMVLDRQTPPVAHRKVLCRHPFDIAKRVYVTPSRVEALYELVWDGRLTKPFPSVLEIRKRVQKQINTFRSDHLRILNPTPYKVSLTSDLYSYMEELREKEMTVKEIF